MISCQPTDPVRITELLNDPRRWQVRCVSATGTPTADLAAAARAGEPAGMVLVADQQTAGRGRFERVWESPPGVSVAMSILLRPSRQTRTWGWLSLLVGVAVTGALRELGGGERVGLKWPNDALIDDRKICGILCELVNTPQGDAAVCGWGINLAMTAGQLPTPQATSLLVAGLSIDKEALIAAILDRLAELVDRWDAGEDLSAEFARSCQTIGREVRVYLDRQAPDSASVTGRAVGIGPHGELLVEIAGRVETFPVGDVVHLR